MQQENLKKILTQAFNLGFSASSEGFNGSCCIKEYAPNFQQVLDCGKAWMEDVEPLVELREDLIDWLLENTK